ncbi:hypothetical protein OG625_07640 [Streptomyces sp. NBC_01351]|uniref:hypothetical protein n=1 Tax=Streptomyces sp. NBC_01351 TaxID=2903833 RepID=UPI002E377B89|nr:hypothetical protein [Streptomyces sp. NBC_01351]
MAGNSAALDAEIARQGVRMAAYELGAVLSASTVAAQLGISMYASAQTEESDSVGEAVGRGLSEGILAATTAPLLYAGLVGLVSCAGFGFAAHTNRVKLMQRRMGVR